MTQSATNKLLSSDDYFVKLATLSAIIIIVIRIAYILMPFHHPDEFTLTTFGAQTSINNGVYGIDYYDGRGPLAFLIYAGIIKVAGYGNYIKTHLYGFLYFCIISGLLYLVAFRWFGKRQAGLALLIFAVSSFAQNVGDAIALNIELLALPALLAALVFGTPSTSPSLLNNFTKYIFAGLFLGLTFSIRQSMAVILPLLLIQPFIIYNNNKVNVKLFLSFSVIVGFFIGFFMGYIHPIINGAFKESIYCSIFHAFLHPVTTWGARIESIIQRLTVFTFHQPLISGLMILSLGYSYQKLNENYKSNWPQVFMAIAMLLQFIAMFVMGRAGSRYMYAAMPFISILIADYIINKNWLNILGRKLIYFILIIGLLVPVVKFILFPGGIMMKEFWLKSLVYESMRVDDPYSKAALFIKNNSQPSEPIFVAGQSYAILRLYPFSQRLPSTLISHPDFFTYRKLSDVIEDLEKHRPNIICVPSVSLGGLTGSNAVQFQEYLAANYKLVFETSWNDFYRFFMGKSAAFEKSKDYIKIFMLK